MEFQIIGKKCSRYGFWKKCALHVANDTITFSKPKSKKNQEIIVASPNTVITYENADGKDQIIIKDKSTTIKFTCKSDILDCLLALRSTKFANTLLHVNDFSVMANIGQGSFGLVSLVQHRVSKKIYAMKCINKTHLYKTKSVKTVLTERELLQKIYNGNPFLIKMEFAFQTATDFYIGLEYAPGGDMRRFLNHSKTISIPDVRIYISEIAIGLNYLHKQKILYRDLKPENILITASGHIKLSDFGLSKELNINKTSTFCGTLSYLAPEIVSHHSYSYEADWYQLGVIAYELSFGKIPFDDDDRRKTMELIVGEEPAFPNDADSVLVDLIKCLLEKDPTKRMNFESLQKHQFFNNFSFREVEEKKIIPSFIPRISSLADTRYFSPEFDSETTENEITTDDLNLFKGFSFISDEFKKCI